MVWAWSSWRWETLLRWTAESFHTKKLCSRLFSREVEFYWHKQRYHVFVPPFGGLRGNAHGSSMARWKARGRLPISANWIFFASYARLRHYEPILVEIVVLKRGGSLSAQISGGKGRPPPTNFGTRKLESLGYRMEKKNCRKLQTGWVGCTNVTDRRQPDRLICDSI